MKRRSQADGNRASFKVFDSHPKDAPDAGWSSESNDMGLWTVQSENGQGEHLEKGHSKS
ncbi:hypothetical protein LOC67_25900 [Stieleria sp. JC731]|uniref:hypothetical protein n=1 Tax=Pirellulaceae TaxID=2691357 RepID=UPI001E56CC2F|nr:hypothetical protein [Stieleria sp. JC731]MCC9604001.1 hypothetical protein [Stieleria sp. JC731]